MTKLIVVDTETTGLDVRRHEPWDIAMQEISPRAETVGVVREWHPTVDVTKADPTSLRMNGFYERTSDAEWKWDYPDRAARDIALFTNGAIVIGTNPKFDIGFIEAFLLRNNQCPSWDYHDLDVSNLIIGFAIGTGGVNEKPQLPTGWKSTQLSEMVGVDADAFDRHTARGDVEWVVAQLQNMLMLGDKNV